MLVIDRVTFIDAASTARTIINYDILESSPTNQAWILYDVFLTSLKVRSLRSLEGIECLRRHKIIGKSSKT